MQPSLITQKKITGILCELSAMQMTYRKCQAL